MFLGIGYEYQHSRHDEVETLRHMALLSLKKGDWAEASQRALAARQKFDNLGMRAHVTEMEEILLEAQTHQ